MGRRCRSCCCTAGSCLGRLPRVALRRLTMSTPRRIIRAPKPPTPTCLSPTLRLLDLPFATSRPAGGPLPCPRAACFRPAVVLQQAPAQAVVWGFCASSTAGQPPKLSLLLAPNDGGGTATVPVAVARYNSTASTWRAVLPATAAKKAGGDGAAVTYMLTVSSGSASASIEDVLFGELWVCSGQSNSASRGTSCHPPPRPLALPCVLPCKQCAPCTCPPDFSRAQWPFCSRMR